MISMTTLAEEVMTLWDSVKTMVDDLDSDVTKNGEGGNLAAGVRARVGMRQVRAVLAKAIKTTKDNDAQVKAANRLAKTAPPATP